MPNHEIEPVCHPDSRILILGSFPSVKSRETGFYYGHPQNRFWKILSIIYEEGIPETIMEKKDFLKRNRIALWDVISSCDIQGSSDASIHNIVVNDIKEIIKNTQIRKIFLNGRKAEKLYEIYLKEEITIPSVFLPSTSPANASWSLERLLQAWKQINE